MLLKIKTVLFVGLNDKDLLKQVINTDEAIKIIKQCLYYRGFNYCTLSNCNGVYVMNSDGASVDEASIKIELIDSIYNTIKTRNNLKNVIDDLKAQLNQESILKISQFIKAQF